MSESRGRENEPSLLNLFERLVNECVARYEAEGSGAVEDVCGRHPEHAARIRERVEWLAGAGLLEERSFPERLGEFRLIRRLGSGGMGTVFLAEQESLGRQVALKVMRPEQLFFEGSKARFQREVEAIARFKHPGIVPIFTVGEDNGVPYYAMERVEGCTFAELIGRVRGSPVEKLTGRDLVRALDDTLDTVTDDAEVPDSLRGSWADVWFRLVAQVALALDHAHCRGVIHRDIKPSNIMLTRDGRALLLDFGLASTEGAGELTASGSRLGSLPYMSPEQLEHGALDARTDVYSLGATLYELLALREPYVGQTSESTIQLIRDGRPRSIRLFNIKVPWDAETVCLAAMEASPRLRYPSAKELAADLDRFVRREPVRARRPGLALLTRRWIQRRPGAAAAILLGFLLTAGLPTALLVQEKAAARRIQREAETAMRVSWLLIDLFQSADRGFTEGEELPARVILDRAAARIENELDEEPAVRATLMHVLGSVHYNLGLFERAEQLISGSLELALDAPEKNDDLIAAGHEGLANVYFKSGRLANAEEHARNAVAARRRIAPEAGSTFVARAMSVLARVLRRRGKSDEAMRLYEDAVRMIRRLEVGDHSHAAIALSSWGNALMDQHHPQPALIPLREACDMLARLYPAGHVHTMQVQIQLGDALRDLGHLEQAETAFEEASRIAVVVVDAESLEMASLDSSLGCLLRIRNRLSEARTRLERALQIRRDKLAADSPLLADTLNNLGIVFGESGQPGRARELHAEATAIYRKLHQDPHHDLAISLTNLASVSPDGEKLAREAVEMHRGLAEENVELLAVSLRILARFLGLRGQFETAEAAIDEALRLLAERHPAGHRTTAEALNTQCLILLLKGDGEAGLTNGRRSLGLWQRLFPGDHGGTALAHYFVGWASRLQRDFATAETHLLVARDMQQRVLPAGSEILGFTLRELGPVLAVNKKLEQAEAVLEASVELSRQVHAPGHQFLNRSLLDCSRVLEMCGKLDRAEQLGWECLELQRQGRANANRWSHEAVGRMLAFIEAHQKGAAGIPSLLRLLDYTTDLFPRHARELHGVATALTGRSVAGERFAEAARALNTALEIVGAETRSGIVLLEKLVALHEAWGEDNDRVADLKTRLDAARQALEQQKRDR